MFRVSPQTLRRVRDVAHGEHASFRAAALWGSLQPDRHTIVAHVPIQRPEGIQPAGATAWEPEQQQQQQALPIAFTVRWVAW